MRIKHNKKRNTAFVYEALIVEATVAVLKKDVRRQNKVINIIKRHFNSDAILKKDLNCYRSLYESQNLKTDASKRIVREAKLQQKLLDPNGVFEAQTQLIHDINKNLSPSIFNNFVPNYKDIATLGLFFQDNNLNAKKRIMLEDKMVSFLGRKEEVLTEMKHIDKLEFKMFVKRFNDTYEH